MSFAPRRQLLTWMHLAWAVIALSLPSLHWGLDLGPVIFSLQSQNKDNVCVDGNPGWGNVVVTACDLSSPTQRLTLVWLDSSKNWAQVAISGKDVCLDETGDGTNQLRFNLCNATLPSQRWFFDFSSYLLIHPDPDNHENQVCVSDGGASADSFWSYLEVVPCYSESTNQTFTLFQVYLENGLRVAGPQNFTLQVFGSDSCISADTQANTVSTRTCDGSGAQAFVFQWTKPTLTAGLLCLAKNVMLCLGVDNSGDGVTLASIDENDDSQVWFFDSSTGFLHSLYPLSKCLAKGAPMSLVDCVSSASMFFLNIQGTLSSISPGRNRSQLVNRMSGKCITVDVLTAELSTATCNRSISTATNQLFVTFQPDMSVSAFQLQFWNSTLCLDDNGASALDSAPVSLWPCDSTSPSQLFFWEPTSQRIRSFLKPYLCMASQSSNPLWFTWCNGSYTASQVFTRIDFGLSEEDTAAAAMRPFGKGYNDSSLLARKFFNRWSRYLSVDLPNNTLPDFSNILPVYINATTPLPRASLPKCYDPAALWQNIYNQGQCRSCWALASMDAAAASTAIVERGKWGRDQGGSASTSLWGAPRIPLLAPMVVAKCSANGADQRGAKGMEGGCNGGHPANALEAATAMGLPPSTLQFGPTTCSRSQARNAPLKVLMYESVNLRGLLGLLKAVSVQPVVVSVQSTSTHFQNYPTAIDKKRGGIFLELLTETEPCYDGALDHSVLVVGYKFDANFLPYWIIRNSWGTRWGYDGYMTMAWYADSFRPEGTCGIYASPGWYPVPAPAAGDPCYTVTRELYSGNTWNRDMNPCGSGTCTPQPDWGPYSYQCSCPSGFVAVNNTVNITNTLPDAMTGITQTCATISPCSTSLMNPCGAGSCTDDLRGGYVCVCPPGFDSFNNPDNSSTCRPAGAPPGDVRNFTIPPKGISCEWIYITFGLSRAQFVRQNNNLDCSRPLLPSRVRTVSVTNVGFPGCITPYHVNQRDTCASISSLVGINVSTLQQYNPGLDCQRQLLNNVQICLEPGTPPTDYRCISWIEVQTGDTCSSLISRGFGGDAMGFFTHNPSVDCDGVAASAASQLVTSVCSIADLGQDEGCGRCPQVPPKPTIQNEPLATLTCAAIAKKWDFSSAAAMEKRQRVTCNRKKSYKCPNTKAKGRRYYFCAPPKTKR